MVLVRNRHSPRERMGGCGEANSGSATAGDWALAVNEKANIKKEAQEKTSVANLKQFLILIGTTFRAGTRQRPKTLRVALFRCAPIIREKTCKGPYGELPMMHARIGGVYSPGVD